MSLRYRTFFVRLLIGLMLSALALSCKQYEYASPLPGILEVHLQVINNRQNTIPFGAPNTFGVLLKELNAVEPGNVRLPIYADVNAIRRSPDGDPLNSLDSLALDGNLVLGAAYAPPTVFANLEMTMTFDQFIIAVHGRVPIPTVIAVQPPASPAPPVQTFFQVPNPPLSSNIVVNEGRRTVVTVGLNLDSVLVRHAEVFVLNPSFSIVSVQNY